MGLLNSSKKIVTNSNKNYLYFGTLFLIAAQILCFYLFKDQLSNLCAENDLFCFLFSWMQHVNEFHLYISIACLLVCGMFFERKFGTMGFITMFIVFGFVSSFATVAMVGKDFVGMDGLIFALYGFFIMVLLFNFKEHLNFRELPLTLVCLVFIVLTMFWSGNVETGIIGFFDFEKGVAIMQQGNIASFIIGALCADMFYTLSLTKRGSTADAPVNAVKEKKQKKQKVNNINAQPELTPEQHQAMIHQQMLIQQQQQIIMQQAAQMQQQMVQASDAPQMPVEAPVLADNGDEEKPMAEQSSPPPAQQPLGGGMSQEEINAAWKKHTDELQRMSANKKEEEE